MIPTREQILAAYDGIDDNDKTATGFIPRSTGRELFCDWFLAHAGDHYITKAGRILSGHTPMRIRGLYLLEKALNARHRAMAKSLRDSVPEITAASAT